MAFGLWMPPIKSWTTADGRRISFDLLAQRLLRGDRRFGVCSGTHRVYSLLLLWRLDEDFDILTPKIHRRISRHLHEVRALLIESQFDDGHWPSNWSEGDHATESPIEDPLYKQVIATGHHLEWLAIAPREFHPPRERIRRAAQWLIKKTIERSEAEILKHYTFYSHVGNALALWRGTHPAEFWQRWQEDEADRVQRTSSDIESL